MPDVVMKWTMCKDTGSGLIHEVMTDSGSIDDKDISYSWKVHKR